MNDQLTLDDAMHSRRYHAKRQHGISPVRRDGSRCDPENDRQSEKAEAFGCRLFGEAYDGNIYYTEGDRRDMRLPDGRSVNFQWLAFDKSGEPRTCGHIIVNPDEPQRWADVYVAISGSIEKGFEPSGWTDHATVIRRIKDFGYGPKFCCPTHQLWPMESLCKT